ncbi:hypothetical protein ATE47_03985 [Chryseobacterium sp. IHB B 17019]|uniref:hypothetical protein n=1 Tax=Chryseobacterium sp. IHB B 17019 TaxID=1721091 RepID=UPI00071EEB27|nr:hypothetical protein [Chryseobacterium sp. IHB B 17019]ALR29731.1 hypothetical protein ATE47_03985 [Chryseobacterium sp. IHB B 17019]
MKELVADKESIKFELKAIQDFIELNISEEEITAVEIRGNELNAYMARSGKLLADAKYHRDEKLKDSVFDNLKEILKLSATTANKYIDSLCKEENYLVNWADRINRTVTHQLDWCRSVLSKQKEELRQNQYSN